MGSLKGIALHVVILSPLMQKELEQLHLELCFPFSKHSWPGGGIRTGFEGGGVEVGRDYINRFPEKHKGLSL